MENRTTTSIIHINHAFLLPVSKQLFPPGEYTISQEEELIEGVSWLAYQRKATFIDIPPEACLRRSPDLDCDGLLRELPTSDADFNRYRRAQPHQTAVQASLLFPISS